MTEDKIEGIYGPGQQIGPVEPPEGPHQHVIDPELDPEINARKAEEALAASEAALQQEKNEAAMAIDVNNDAAAKAIEALKAGEPLQDEPI
jgi:hypothetical protein